ncbi:CVNH domain-containing protein [Xanthobacter aminoxidans]|uniref:CVNH domain-containing protein n=1 Tax=Xanthobacter aminoxidans TaxID=186280 RepID=UPI002022C9AD|nr:CVNH domain-containing protein [Xanthobacter aminoxidans]MCL8381182.1 CVNH domain-containing protein [Xanthobacter aminoxidans]
MAGARDRLLSGALAVLGWMLAAGLSPAAAQSVPPGSYLSSCRQVQVRFGHDLAAFCPNRAGRDVVTRLDNFPACRGDIANVDGRLTCAAGGGGGILGPGGIAPSPTPSFQQVPAGPYKASCRNIRMDGPWLRASCRDDWGGWRDASLMPAGCIPGKGIVYEDGRLSCGGSGFSGDRPPAGSYRASCRDISYSAGLIRATCRNSFGSWVPTTLATSWCGHGRDIRNEGGSLTCRPEGSPVPDDHKWGGGSWGGNGGSGGGSGGGSALPSGSYRATCRNISMSAGWLKASCKSTSGTWKDSSTFASWCSGGSHDIANVDGRLTCR